MMRTCQSCNNIVESEFCPYCGEKKFSEADLSLHAIITEFWEILSSMNLNFKFLRSFNYLIWPPGQLVKLYCQGIRVAVYNPMRMFAFSNILFYLLLNGNLIFTSTVTEMIDGYSDIISGQNLMHFNISEALEQFKNQYGYVDVDGIKEQINNVSSDISRSAIIFLVPLIALPIYLFNSRSFFMKSYVIAINFLSVFMVFSIIVFFPFFIFDWHLTTPFYFAFYILLFLSFGASSYRIFGKTIIRTITESLIILLFFLLLLNLYKQLILIVALKIWPAKVFLSLCLVQRNSA